MSCLYWLLGLVWWNACLIVAWITGDWEWILVGVWGILGLWWIHVGVELRKEAKELRLLTLWLVGREPQKKRPGSGSPQPEPPEAPE